ncbi:hypothetical protein NKH61_27820 [Mesorhizobium sp. M1005]|uniref:hypothetical protein n=1 Tax=unclassified Mesorhizobium TaxID=325217 RepID=UPI00333D38EE
MSKTHNLDLLNNSISYFREAVNYAQRDGSETNQWKFAIVHVVQAMELAFKEYLRRIHPAFIWEAIDKPDKTVSMKVALARLRNPSIGKVAISNQEASKIEKAIELRNELTHFEFNHQHAHIELKFAEIFAFVMFFYRSHLGLTTAEFADEEQHQRIIRLVRARAELLEKARAYIRQEDVGDLWICPSCTEGTFVVAEEQCCFCHHREKVVDCESCGQATLASDVADTSDLFDWDYDEGLARILEDFGMAHSGCPECVSSIKEKIEELRRAQYLEDMAMDARALR